MSDFSMAEDVDERFLTARAHLTVLDRKEEEIEEEEGTNVLRVGDIFLREQSGEFRRGNKVQLVFERACGWIKTTYKRFL